jgi:hypothetical protein
LSTLTIDQSVTNAVKAMVVDASANTTTAQTITGKKRVSVATLKPHKFPIEYERFISFSN